ncbi:MAG: sensor histidine kinase [Bacteroides sp.]|nr:sensor histidine kinase [Bacteroides sp.]
MENNSFDFLNHCLDKDTCSYLSLGLDAENPKGEILGKEELLNRISIMLSVDSVMDSPFNETLFNALKPYLGMVGLQSSNSERETDMGKMIDKIFNRFISYLQSQWFIPSKFGFLFPFFPLYVIYQFLTKGKRISLLDLMSLKTKTIYYPYFILAILAPNYPDGYPDWLLYPVQETMKTYGNKLKEGWRKFVKSLFKATDSQNEFTHLMFLVCVLWVLKSEYEKLNTDVLLSGLPMDLPDLNSLKFLDEKISEFIKEKPFNDKENKKYYQFYASLLLGVYESLETKDSLLDSEAEEQRNGNKSKQIEAIEPVKFTKWQAEMLIEAKALNPIFALMSSLRYNGEEEYAKLYNEFLPYEAKKEGCKKLLIDHFFPYNHLQSDYTVMTVGQDDVLPSSNGESAEEWSYLPPTEKGINLELIDKLYLYFNHLPLDILKHPDALSVNGYDIIQVEKVDPDVVRRYAALFSDKGHWSIVKDRFESEVENRVKDIFSLLRHNIKDEFETIKENLEYIESILNNIEENHEHGVIKSNVIDSLQRLNKVWTKWNEESKRIADEKTRIKRNFLCVISKSILLRKVKGVTIELENRNVPDDFEYEFWGEGASWFQTMVENIINNAISHGFSRGNDGFVSPDNKRIVVQTSICNQILSLKIMNNGRKSLVNIDEFRAQGVTKSQGHSGLGGAQIDEIARRHGGVISLSSSDDWNFILNIDFKL